MSCASHQQNGTRKKYTTANFLWAGIGGKGVHKVDLQKTKGWAIIRTLSKNIRSFYCITTEKLIK